MIELVQGDALVEVAKLGARVGNAERIARENQQEPEIRPLRLPDSAGQEKKPWT